MDLVFSPYTSTRVIEGLSIKKSGRIGLPKYFILTRGIQPGMRAHLYWDIGNHMIAMHFASSTDPTVFPIHFTRQYGAFIQALRFFQDNRLESEHCKGRYDYKPMRGRSVGLPEATDVFIIGLTKPRASMSDHVEA